LEAIEKFGAWAYSNGASQGDPMMGGVGGIIYLRDSHSLRFLGQIINNYA
jgi:hypothetical protein